MFHLFFPLSFYILILLCSFTQNYHKSLYVERNLPLIITPKITKLRMIFDENMREFEPFICNIRS